MGEIKSTIELMMERTKNLKMTADEKAAVRREETTKKVRGWIQRCVDATMDRESLKKEFAGELREHPEARDIFRRELLGHIQMDGDNQTLFWMFKRLLGGDPQPYERLVRYFLQATETLQAERKKTIRKALEGAGISGSAVVPNLNMDDQYQLDLASLKKDFQRQLETL